MRWILRLREFDLDITHRKGKLSGNFDAITREPVLGERPHGEEKVEELYSVLAAKRCREATVADQVVKTPRKKVCTEKDEFDENYDDTEDESQENKKPFFECKEDLDARSMEERTDSV